ncbi:MAG: GDSL family lipase, partial [Candidatus Spyradocola sp.]
WQPDVIVVALGHNDSSAFNTPAHTDPATGETFKQRTDPDGKRNAQDVQRLENAIVAFLHKLRDRNPQAQILWAHGLLGDPLREELQHAIHTYCAETGDAKCEYVALPYGPEDGMGARNHPGQPMHEASAQALAQKIRSLF